MPFSPLLKASLQAPERENLHAPANRTNRKSVHFANNRKFPVQKS